MYLLDLVKSMLQNLQRAASNEVFLVMGVMDWEIFLDFSVYFPSRKQASKAF